jgi:hypothetical protein
VLNHNHTPFKPGLVTNTFYASLSDKLNKSVLGVLYSFLLAKCLRNAGFSSLDYARSEDGEHPVRNRQFFDFFIFLPIS